MHEQLTYFERNLLLIEKTGDLDHKEKRLARIIRAWIDYAEGMLDHFSDDKTDDQSSAQLTPEQHHTTEIQSVAECPLEDLQDSKKTSSKPKISLENPYPLNLSGPVRDYADRVQHIGNAYYLILHGHFLRSKRCPKAQWDIPTYIVYVAGKAKKPAFQLRIDLRSIDIPYYSKLHWSPEIRQSLVASLDDLSNQLKSVSKIKKSKKMVDRAKTAKRKNLSLTDNPALRLVRDSSGDAMSVEVSLSAPNNDAIARFTARIGSSKKPNPKNYENRTRELYKLSVLHTKFSSERRYGNGASISFNLLYLQTQSSIVDVLSAELRLESTDTAHFFSSLTLS